MKIIIILSILFFLAIIWMTGKYLAEREFDRQVDTLFKKSGEIQNKNFQYSQLQNLPEPVQRYFKLVLPEGQPYISYIRLEHDGQFKIDPIKNGQILKVNSILQHNHLALSGKVQQICLLQEICFCQGKAV